MNDQDIKLGFELKANILLQCKRAMFIKKIIIL